MTLRARLTLGIFAIAALLLLPLYIAFHALHEARDAVREIKGQDFGASIAVGRIRGKIYDVSRAEDALIFFPDSARRDRMSAEVESLAVMTRELDKFELDSTARRLREAVRTIDSLAPLEYAAALAERRAEADSISNRHMRPAIGTAFTWADRSETLLRNRTQERVEAAEDATAEAGRFTALAFAIAGLLAAIIAILLTRSISRPVRDLERGMQAVADGELSHNLAIRPSRHDEFGRLAESYRSMVSQLAELDKLKAEFISVASHELKTPINVILGYVQLLDEGVFGELNPKQREICATLNTQAQSLARLVKQLLDVSRFEAGGGKLDIRRVELKRFFGDLERAFHVLALQRGVTFRVSVSERLPHEAMWDADRMNEVIGNLLSNAFKFTGAGGRVELSAERTDGSIVLEVRDTGAGIPPAQLPHIFEKFYQADNQREAAAKGTGLGLAIAKQIVEAHGGTVSCESSLGRGTSFRITLPLRAA
jgi:signal transduction histidine kinase